MPELPEVESVVRAIGPLLRGAVLGKVRLLRADILEPPGIDLVTCLAGRSVRSVERRAKRIIFLLDNDHRFYIHLGMTGQLTVEPPGEPLRKHTHLLIEFAAKTLRFVDARRFGGIWWLGKDGPADDGLGPEPLQLPAAELAHRLAGTRRIIKSALLDQKIIAGLGNIYADEALFLAGIRPQRRADRLSHEQTMRLSRSIKTVLRQAIAHGGSTVRDYRNADGKPGEFQKRHRVYQRTGLPCVVCGTVILRRVLGGRSAHFCPKCQH
jgi:formamidopyrimidine-DNA glycosylase